MGQFIAPNGMAALGELGLAERVYEKGKHLKARDVANAIGSSFTKIKYDRGGSTLMPVGISYSAVLKVLQDALRQQNVRVYYQAPVSSIRLVDRPGGVQQVHCSFGAGRPGQTYDMLLAADGVNSKVRWALFPAKEYGVKQEYPAFDILSGVIERPVGISNDTLQEYWGSGSRLITMPLEDDKLAVWATQNVIVPTHLLKPMLVDYHIFRERFVPKYSGLDLEKILRSLEESNIKLWQNFPCQTKMRTWVRGPVALLGSAAHSVVPTLHQDLSLCFEDAAVLCKVFAQEGATSAALESWVARRYKRVFDVQRLSSELVSSAQAPSGLRVWWRALTMRVFFARNVTKRDKVAIAGYPQ
jgi:2-polyprenyl-6-methoxyphenol hydroxylase-like FAD-dependent oxidoreductase